MHYVPHTTQEQTDWIFARDAAERAGAGGIAAVEAVELVEEPTGKVWGHNKDRKGPLDGKPETKYSVRIFYQGGKYRIFTCMERSFSSKKES